MATIVSKRPATRRRDPFQLQMLVVMYGILAAGFGFKAVMRRFDFYTGATVFPTVLYWHALVATLWLVVYAAQVVLVYRGKLRWHRQLGMASLALAVAMPPLGVMAGVAMRHFDIYQHGLGATELSAYTFLAILTWDMVLFSALVSAGYLLRKRPDWHRRLMFLATLSMSHAGTARIAVPGFVLLGVAFYIPDHVLIATAAWHDHRTLGRVHPAYRIVWPLWALGQTAAMVLWLGHPAWFLGLCKSVILSWG